MSRMTVRNVVRGGLAVSALCFLGAAAAHAAEATALVEEIGDPRPGVQFMDFLSPGLKIQLKPGERFVVDYIKSCVRETIVGGAVTIGTERSVVVGGTISSETVECDGGKGLLTTAQASAAGVMVFRKATIKNAAAPASPPPVMPSLTLYGASPLFELKSSGSLVIERVDQPGERHVADIAGSGKHVFYDSAKDGVVLAPGGVYKASSGGKDVTFRVADTALPGAQPPITRLLRF